MASIARLKPQTRITLPASHSIGILSLKRLANQLSAVFQKSDDLSCTRQTKDAAISRLR
jgi:hypothetical protein